MDNATIAQHLLKHARELAQNADNLYRVKAYRQAADIIQRLDRPVEEILATEGRRGLLALPGIGSHLAFTLERLIHTGQFRTLSATPDAEDQVSSLSGVGPVLSRLLEDRLGVTTVADLQKAVQDGRLDQAGFGRGRVQSVRGALAERLGQNRDVEAPQGEPSVAELLAVDEEYRRQAQENLLPTIAPHRFNAEGRSWLPLFHVRRNGWRYRALFSNTALAHRLNRTQDWVVVYFNNEQTNGQRTVVTEMHGDLRGRRVVRGRENECRAYYEQKANAG